MRKIDYQILADIIRAARVASSKSEKPAEWRAGYASACEAVAKNFANRASVNRDEFLRACGIAQ